jgi:hypothetical protein
MRSSLPIICCQISPLRELGIPFLRASLNFLVTLENGSFNYGICCSFHCLIRSIESSGACFNFKTDIIASLIYCYACSFDIYCYYCCSAPSTFSFQSSSSNFSISFLILSFTSSYSSSSFLDALLD